MHADHKERILIELITVAVCVSVVALYLRAIVLKDFQIIDSEPSLGEEQSL